MDPTTRASIRSEINLDQGSESDSSGGSPPDAGANGNPNTPPAPYIHPSNLPGAKRALRGISIRSFLLGQAAGTCAIIAIILLYFSNALWRAPLFVASLAIFHFLEFYITASYNPLFATITSFLLSSNGSAYHIAHTTALLECILGRLFLPDSYFGWTSILFGGVTAQVTIGLICMVVGQLVRNFAMVQAGWNFNHTIQRQKRDDHVLVQTGIYSVLRHPSYFGFFWWAVGTQIMLGNSVSLLGYLVVLWQFFSSRIESELLTYPFHSSYVKNLADIIYFKK
ncbi:hypothetical protein FQN57_005020 [Myotisia sp. PD_48]|nr:hypothetical protein FQN57_005020 [Myotisia sp. PD_48]